MTTRVRPEHCLYLNALVALKNTLQLRTAVFSEASFGPVVSEEPAAITLSGPGQLNAEGLLGGFLRKRDLFRKIIEPGRKVRRWKYYGLEPKTRALEARGLLTSSQLRSKAQDFAREPEVQHAVWAFVPAVEWTTEREEAIRDALCDVILQSATGISVSELKDRSATSNRETLVRVRAEMLDKVGSYSSEDLAAAAESISANASQFALDQRNAGKIFGVRFGRSWHYPQFQFDSNRRPYLEMRAILAALPDDQGWDRVQWFLEPHEKLKGRTPLQIWKTDRDKVIEAANMERWNERL